MYKTHRFSKTHAQNRPKENSLALASWCAMRGRLRKIGGVVSGEILGRVATIPAPSIKNNSPRNADNARICRSPSPMDSEDAARPKPASLKRVAWELGISRLSEVIRRSIRSGPATSLGKNLVRLLAVPAQCGHNRSRESQRCNWLTEQRLKRLRNISPMPRPWQTKRT